MKASQINEFRLFAHGKAFNPQAFLETTTLNFDGVWHKGELGHDHPKSSGIFKILGDGPTVPLEEQEQIAIDYLSANHDALKLLAQAPGVTTFILGLQYQVKLEENITGFAIGPSAPLMSLALDIGIAPTYYIMLERKEAWESAPED
jgi:hypothetical protein